MSENNFNWNAEDYAKNSEAQRKWAMELIGLLNLKGNESVLDIGCGDGKITAEIACLVKDGEVIGIDNSTEMINLARNKFQPAMHPNLSFEVMDAKKISFVNQFDVVFSNAALHWIKGHDEVMKSIAASLRPNGRIMLQMGGKGNASDILNCFNEMMSEKEWSKYFLDFDFTYNFLDANDYRTMLSKYGLIEKQVALIPKNMTPKGKDGLAGWIRTTWLPYLEKIPTGTLREEFVSAVVERYVSKFPVDESGFVHVKMVRLQVEAYKQ